MSRLTWPMWIIALGILFGVAGALETLIAGPAMEAKLVFLSIAIWQARGASSAAACIVIGTVIQQLRGKPLAVADGQAARLIAVIEGVGLFATAAIVMTIGMVPSLAAIGLIGLALGFAGWWAALRPMAAVSVVLLVGAAVLFELPRELGWFDVSWVSRSTSSHTDRKDESKCIDDDGHHGPLQPVGSLDGNVGELVFDNARAGATQVVRFGGTLSVNWAACMLPLYKPLSIETTLYYAFDVGTCSGSGTLDFTLRTTAIGIRSCHGLREELAREVHEELAKVAEQLGR
jgi:hypothetical protein